MADTRRPRVTAPPDALLDALAERYDGAPFRPVGHLEGGWANDVFLLESPAGRVVLRRKHPPSDPTDVSWEHRVVAALALRVPQAVVPLPARDGATFFLIEGDAAWLVPYVDGVPAERRSDRHRTAAARLLGRLHQASRELDLGERPGGHGLSELSSLDAGGLPAAWRRRVAGLQLDALRTLDLLERRQPARGVVHGDFFRGNVLVRGEPPADDDLLVPLIRAKRVLELLRAPSDRFVDWEYQEHNLRAAERLA